MNQVIISRYGFNTITKWKW